MISKLSTLSNNLVSKKAHPFARLLLLALPLVLILVPAASADLTGTNCANIPPPTQTGGTLWRVRAVNPAPVSATAVCFNTTQNGQGINFTPGYLETNPCGNPQPIAIGARGGRVWTDWGNNPCISSGATISIVFSDASQSTFSLSSIQWVGSDGHVYATTTGSIEQVGAVGGTVFSVDKMGILAPYLGLTIIVAGAAFGAFYVTRSRKRSVSLHA